MLGELIIWNLIGAAAKAHNKNVREAYRAKYPITYSKDVPRIKVEPKPFSFYLNEAIN